MKRLIIILLILCSTSGFGQIEKFNGHSIDTTFNQQHLPTLIVYRDKYGDEVGQILMKYFEDNTLWSLGSISKKGYIFVEYNKQGDVVREKTKHVNRRDANAYFKYEYGESGLFERIYFIDSTKTLQYYQEFEYNSTGSNFTQTRTYDPKRNLIRYNNYTYTSAGIIETYNTFNNKHQLTVREAIADASEDGRRYKYKYVYNADGTLTTINYLFYDENNSVAEKGAVNYQYAKGKLKTFVVGDKAPLKVKKNKDNQWVLAYHYGSKQNQNEQMNPVK